jgi:2-dehydropantoate 2-reductase
VLADAAIVLVAVKGRDTEAMGRTIAEHAPVDAVVVSLQNGVANPERLRSVLPGRDVRAGMVGFNVVMREPGVTRRATGGHVMVAAGPRAGLGAALSVPGMPVQERADMDGVAWTKMLINLNNGLNALSGLPLYDEITHDGWRKLWAASIREGLKEAAAAGVTPVKVMGPPPKLFAAMLSLPGPIFRILAERAFKVSPEARSSMADDLAAGRPTEIDDLQGEIVRRAEARGAKAPVCAATLALIKECETAGPGSPPRTPEDVWARARG